jgi:hypothetical protein
MDKKTNCAVPASMYPTQEEQKKTLKETSNEDIGKYLRQEKEAREFLNARGIYV